MRSSSRIWSSGVGGVALFLLAGLLLVPVECAAAAGPHSIYVSASSLAMLQAGPLGPAAAHHQGHAPSPPASEPHDAGVAPSVTEHAHPSDSAPAAGQATTGVMERGSPPITGSVAGDAVVAFTIPDRESSLLVDMTGVVGHALLLAPPGRGPLGPEPPPP